LTESCVVLPNVNFAILNLKLQILNTFYF